MILKTSWVKKLQSLCLSSLASVSSLGIEEKFWLLSKNFASVESFPPALCLPILSHLPRPLTLSFYYPT